MSKILILSSFQVYGNTIPAPTPATSGLILLNVLRQAGYDATLIDYVAKLDYETQFKEILKKHSDVELILISNSLWFDKFLSITDKVDILSWKHTGRPIFKRFLKDLKDTGAKIAIGGSTLRWSILNKMFAQSTLKYIDFAVMGQGENSVLAIASHVFKGTPINSKTYGSKPTHVIDESNYPFVLHQGSYAIDSLDFEDLNGSVYAPLELARGCAFKCAFCNYPLIGNSSIDMAHTKENLIKTFEYYNRNWGITMFTVMDDVINDSKDKMVFLRDIVQSLSFEPKIYCYARLDMWENAKIREIAKDCGIHGYMAGIETTHPEVGKRTGKGFSPDRIKKITDLVKRDAPTMVMDTSFIYLMNGETDKHFETVTVPMLMDTDLIPTFKIGELTLATTLLDGDAHSAISKDPFLFGINIKGDTWDQGEFDRDELVINAEKWSRYINQARNLDNKAPRFRVFNVGSVYSLAKIDPTILDPSHYLVRNEKMKAAGTLFYKRYAENKLL